MQEYNNSGIIKTFDNDLSFINTESHSGHKLELQSLLHEENSKHKQGWFHCKEVQTMSFNGFLE